MAKNPFDVFDAPSDKPKNPFDVFDEPSQANPFDQFDEKPEADPSSRSLTDIGKDVGVTALKGAVGLPQAAAGLLDIPTLGRAGKALEEVGFRPAETQKILDGWYSDAQKEAIKKVAEAKGFGGTIEAALENPSVIATTVGESLPQMLGGAAVARGGMAVASKLAPWAAAAIGEGVMGAGSAASQIRGDSPDGVLTPTQAAVAVGSGIGTAALGAAGGKVAQRLGLADIETMLASGKATVSPHGFIRQIIGSGISEGVLEELPQSIQEQMWQNFAEGKPLDQGVDKAAAMGMIAGLTMGGAAGGYNAAAPGLPTRQAEQEQAVHPAFVEPDGAAPSAVPSAVPVDAPVAAPAESAASQDLIPSDAAQEALHKREPLTSLDRVDEIKGEQMAASERLAELSDPASGYGPMFDEERASLQRKVDELAAEREALTKDWPKAVEGAPASFSTETGARVEGQYALMSANDLVTSHDELLKLNSAYPQELQPRDRDRAASEVQVAGIVRRLDPARLALSADAANGAPIVGADGLVESGNARTIAMKRVYRAKGQKAEDYKQYLRDNAGQFGLTPEQVDQVENPVLVRVRSTPVNRAEFARQANASTVAQMSPSEQAKSDSNRIDSMEDLQPDENGDFSGAASRPFVRRFMAKLPSTEQAGMVDASGALSTAGYARVRNAVLAKAYGDSPVLARMTESMDDNLRNVSKALMIAAPRVAQMRQMVGEGARHDADITPDLMAAVEELSRLKDSGTTVEDALAQAGMFGEQYSTETKELLQFLAANLRRPRRIADFLVAYMEALDAAGDPNQGSLLGDVAPPAKGELLSAARRSTDEARTENSPQVPAADAQRGDAGENPAAGPQAGGQSENAAGGGGSDQGNGVAESELKPKVVETPEFKRWFGDSKVVDAEGKPLVVYHGTRADFSSFDTDGGLMGPGAWFTPNPRLASGHAKDGSVLPVYLSVRNPYPAKNGTEASLITNERKAELVAQGYDGIYEKRGAIEQWVAFWPEQIKSATGNNGQFDPASADIRLARGDGGASGVNIEDLQALADRIKKSMPNMPEVHVLAKPEEAPEALQNYIKEQGAWSDVEGAMHDGEFYLFASGISDLQRAEHVLAEHEASHFGLRAVLGDSLRSAMNMIYVGNARVRREASKLQARGRLSNAEATEEVIVDIPSAELAQLTGWRKLVLKVRDHLAARGYEKLPAQLTAWVDGTLDEQQRADLYVAELVRSAREYMTGKRSGQPKGFMGVTRLSGTLSQDVEAQEKWLAAEAKARGFYDIEHMVDKDPALFEKLSELWRKKHPGSTALSRAPADAGAKAVADRAEDLIQDKARTVAPVDAVAKAFTKAFQIERLTNAAYNWGGAVLEHTPEKVKAGLVSDYGVPEAVIDQRAMLQGRQRVQLRQAGHLLDELATLTRAESRVAYEWMNSDGKNPQAAAALIKDLPEQSVLVLKKAQNLIDKLSREAVRLGQLTPEAYARNKFAYLRRSYAKHTLAQTPGEKKARARAISVLGDQYKGRGISDEASMKQIQNAAPDWWGRKLKDGKADTSLKGQEFVRLEKRAPSGEGTQALEGMDGKQLGRLQDVVYFPAGETMPAKFADWHQAGTFEVRDVKGDKAIMWRDFTKDEREKMGEIDEARFAIAKTLHAMIHDVEVGRYLEWLSQNYAKKDMAGVTGKIVESEGGLRSYAPGEWVQVPESKVPGTTVLRYGKLSGHYLPGPIWNDLRQIVHGQAKPFGDTFAKLLTAWKTSKTALSPAVHVNNVMSNFVMADWHDVTAGHVAKALRILMGAHDRDGKGLIGRVGNLAARTGVADHDAAREVLNRYLDSGGDIGGWATNEVAKEQIAPLLEAMEAELKESAGDSMPAQIGVMSALQHALHGRFPEAFDSFKGSLPGKAVGNEVDNILNLYQSEDDVFRLAAWLRAKEEGKSDLEAGKIARRSFLDYRINAPWISMLRASALPFVSFTYRAAPMLIETAAKKPHKLLKLMALAGGLNALGVALGGGGDDSERKMLPEEKAGRIWGMVPKLIRMPWNDDNKSPIYLDIRRFIPAGDIVDFGSGHSAIPLFPSMMPSGPLEMIAEIALNKSAFTGKSITLDTDTPSQKAAKFSDYMFKSLAPNLPIPNPIGYAGSAIGAPHGWMQTYSVNGIIDAAHGVTDGFGREQSVPQAVASAFGFKLGSYPEDVLRANLQAKANAEKAELKRNIAMYLRQRQNGKISEEEYNMLRDIENAKINKINAELNEKKN